MQVGAEIVVLPLLLIAVPVVFSAWIQEFLRDETVPAVADATIVGGVDMNTELNGNACWTRNFTWTWLVTYVLSDG